MDIKHLNAWGSKKSSGLSHRLSPVLPIPLALPFRFLDIAGSWPVYFQVYLNLLNDMECSDLAAIEAKY